MSEDKQHAENLGSSVGSSFYSDADDFDDFGDDDGCELGCMSCGGEGVVDSVCKVSGRWGWDDDGPGTCPNCNGSGLRKDQTYF